MAKKNGYKIPAALDENYFNMEITLKNKDGIGLKPLPIRVILIWVVFIVVFFFLCFNKDSPVSAAGVGMQIFFGITWFAFAILMTKMDGARQMRLELIPSLLSYLSKSNRHVITRRSSPANPFYAMVGIEDINDKTGVVKYIDGSYGYWYSVVGSASVLLFPEDREAILDRVDNFYKKMQPDCELIFLTMRQPQNVVRQQAHLMAQYKHLGFADPDIDRLYREQYDVLTDHVGKEFKSLHQYMIIKGDNRDALSVMNSICINECNNSNYMLKECTPLYKKDIEHILREIYSEGE